MVVGLKCRQDVSSVIGINVCRLASIRICQAKRVLGQDVFSLQLYGLTNFTNQKKNDCFVNFRSPGDFYFYFFSG